jgi:hypothetical protein
MTGKGKSKYRNWYPSERREDSYGLLISVLHDANDRDDKFRLYFRSCTYGYKNYIKYLIIYRSYQYRLKSGFPEAALYGHDQVVRIIHRMYIPNLYAYHSIYRQAALNNMMRIVIYLANYIDVGNPQQFSLLDICHKYDIFRYLLERGVQVDEKTLLFADRHKKQMKLYTILLPYIQK